MKFISNSFERFNQKIGAKYGDKMKVNGNLKEEYKKPGRESNKKFSINKMQSRP